MNVYKIQGYEDVRNLLQQRQSRAAYLCLRQHYSATMTEQQLRRVLRQISLNEGKIADFLNSIYGYVSSWVHKAMSVFTAASPRSFIARVERDLPKLKDKSREVETTMDAPVMSKYDIQELQRRIIERIPAPTAKTIEHMRRNLAEHRADDESLSWTSFYHKWFVLFIVYGAAMSLAGLSVFGLGFIKLSLAYLPALVLMIDDLLYQLGEKKFVAP